MAQSFDFSKTQTDSQKNHARFSFEYRVLYAKQLMYDLENSCPGEGHNVVRHRDLREEWDRRKVAESIGMVYLVRELDGLLNWTFRELWTLRPDLLQEWVRRRLSSEDEPNKPISLSINFDELWKPSTKNVSLEQSFRSRILGEWYKTTPKPKVVGIQDILLGFKDAERPRNTPRPGDFPAAKLEIMFRGIEHRNKFAHPGTEEEPQSVVGFKKGVDAPPPGFNDFSDALVDFADWLNEKANDVKGEWIATNIPDISHLLSESQQAAFGLMTEYREGNCRRYTTFEDLTAAIEDGAKRGFKGPRCFVLGTQDDLVRDISKVKSYLASHQDVKVVLCEHGHASNYLDPRDAVVNELAGMETKFKDRFWYVPRSRYKKAPADDLPERVEPILSYDSNDALRKALKQASGR